MDEFDYFDSYEEEMKNPNLYITLESSGGFFAATTFPLNGSITTPFTLNAQN